MMRRAAAVTWNRRFVQGAAALLGSGLLVVACGGGGEEEPAPPPVDEGERYRRDDRVAVLLQSCGVANPYDVATADMLPRLIEKLEKGHVDPLKRSKEELGGFGARLAPPLTRFVSRHYGVAFESGCVENALDAAGMNPSPEMRPIILNCLRHPQEVVRTSALRALMLRHARPEDFDELRARFEGGETLSLRKLLVGAMHAADPGRAEDLFLSWIEEEGFGGEFLELAGAKLLTSTRPETAAGCARLFERLGEPVKISIAACAARGGDEAALRYLDEVLAGDSPEGRLVAAHCLGRARLTERLTVLLRGDPDERVRAIAVAGIGEAAAEDDAWRAYLVPAMDDVAPSVSLQAVKLLAGLGDEDAIARAVRQLEGNATAMQIALQSLREPMLDDPVLAGRAWEILLARAREEEHQPLEVRTTVLKAMGFVPLGEPAEYLHRLGRENPDVRLEGLPAHRWLMIQASNTGDVGRERLYELLAAEDDPFRRLDMINAIGSSRDSATRERLQAITEGEAHSPYEMLVAAGLLVRIGPSTEVAGRLQRVYYAVKNKEVRGALQCLLWEWY